MRILQALAGTPHGGAEIFFERLTSALAAHEDIQQEILIRHNSERAARLRGCQLKVTELPFSGPFDLITRRGFRSAIRQFAPQVVLTWMNRATRFCPQPYGRFVHVGRLGGYYDLKYYRHCDHLIGNTRGIKDYLEAEGWPAERAHYVPNFVPAKKVEPVSRATLVTEEGAPLLLALGRLHDNKAFDVLLMALADVPNAILWIAGEGPNGVLLQQLADSLGIASRVRFLGWREDTAALLAAADVLVCPSRVEPLGNVILEAWAQRVPVVASSAAGPSALIQDQVTGMLVPIDDPGGLARALVQMIDDPAFADAMAAAGYETFEAEYSEAVVTGLYIEFLNEVVAGCAV